MEKKDEQRRKLKTEKSLRLGEILFKQGLITEEQLYQALELQKTRKKMLGEILVEKGLITEEILAQSLASEYLLSYADLTKEEIDGQVVKAFSPAVLRKYRVFPLRFEKEHLLLAVSDPLDILSLQEIGRLSGYPVRPVVATLKQIEATIAKYSAPMQKATDAIEEIISDRAGVAKEEVVQEKALKELELASHEAPIVRIVNSLISEAISQSASDIHLEPQAGGLLVRFRIDGVLYEKLTIPRELQPKVLSRVKIVSGMDIAERRLPQDGRISITAEGLNYDVRVSTLPGIYGEKIVLRLLNKENILLSLDSLGLEAEERATINRLIRRPYGILLLTGPTGSGKTTTLYSILNALNESSRNIVTVEDPIEYELPRIHQTAINVRAGYTFATAIRHILRQDPDVIMVGEIRDLETAEVAMQAAITGHLVLSTLHTNNAAGAITRLLDMNVEPFMISSAIIGVIAQRLVRRLCPLCRKDYPLPDDLKKAVADALPDEKNTQLVFARPQGCEKCMHIGYARRTGVFEILSMTDELRELTLRKADESELSRMALSQGMRTLKASGVVRPFSP